MRRALWRMTNCRVAFAFLLWLTTAASQALGCTPMADSFEGPRLDTEKWSTIQLLPGRFRFEPIDEVSGPRALSLAIGPEDRGCGDDCQRNEVRESSNYRTMFGDECWYAFRFRIEGDFPTTGSQRWVIGQWKQQNGFSPFLAQRFDNGVFHITVESGQQRVLLAKAEGDPEQVARALIGGDLSAFRFLADKYRFRGKRKLALEIGDDPILPDPKKNWVEMMYRVRGGYDGTGVVEVWADRRFIVRATGPIGAEGAEGPTQYFKFGQYRALMPGRSTIWIEDFRRGPTRQDVERAPSAGSG
jgi:hypothetical protein